MFRQDTVNSVFSLDKLNRESDFVEPLKLRRSIAHNPKVLRYDWQLLALAEPRDNKGFSPPNGNLHLSSYLRLGPDEPITGISETHERFEEIYTKEDHIAVFPRRSALNVFSHNLTEDEGRKAILRSAGFELNPDDYGCTDYRTTSRIEYPLHFPIRPWPSTDQNKPWLFYRRTTSYRDEELSSRDCNSKFYDEGMNTHDEIAAMKLERYRSYDPFLKKFTNTSELAKYKCKS